LLSKNNFEDLKKGNFLKNLPKNLSEERIEEIFSSENIKIERIISEGQISPNNFWFNQDKNEFVYLISGEAEIEFENFPKSKLLPGDYIIIPAETRHRVSYTSKNEQTIWLTFFY